MSPSVEQIVERMHEAEADLSREVGAQKRRWHHQLRRGRVWVDQEIRHAQRQFRQSIPSFIVQGSVLNLLTAPFIYSLLLPIPFRTVDPASFVPDYSGVAVPDSHGVPFRLCAT